MKLVFRDQLFSFEMLRTMGHTAYGGADIGECLATAYQIKDSDAESWYVEWRKIADRVRASADESRSGGHTVSPREAYLRAANYYRTAAVFLPVNPNDPRIGATWERSRACFGAAAQLFSPPFEAVEIPYEGTTLPGYFYRVDERGAARPTVIVHGGLGATHEELYFAGVAGALRRGYNCLAFEGPGQGRVLRQQRLPMRPDWERVITPVVDYALTRSEIAPCRMILMGFDLGGYLAARAAAFEGRLAACLIVHGLFDVYEWMMTQMPRLLRGHNAQADHPIVDMAIQALMRFDSTRRWKFTHGIWACRASSLQAWLRLIGNYTLAGVAGKITCPTLILDSERDHRLHGQAWKVYKALSCPKTYLRFMAEEGAGVHCPVGGSVVCDQRIFDWLDETLKYRVWQPSSRRTSSENRSQAHMSMDVDEAPRLYPRSVA